MGEAVLAISTSERALERSMQAVLGKTPLTYFQDLRVEHAVHLLQTNDEGVERITTLVGYGDGTTLRTLLRRKLGKGVRELRARGHGSTALDGWWPQCGQAHSQ